jgi:hypothetical protein
VYLDNGPTYRGQALGLDLNVGLWAFIDQNYHRAPHDGLFDKSPQSVYARAPPLASMRRAQLAPPLTRPRRCSIAPSARSLRPKDEREHDLQRRPPRPRPWQPYGRRARVEDVLPRGNCPRLFIPSEGGVIRNLTS